jgi:hypothetical protein
VNAVPFVEPRVIQQVVPVKPGPNLLRAYGILHWIVFPLWVFATETSGRPRIDNRAALCRSSKLLKT